MPREDLAPVTPSVVRRWVVLLLLLSVLQWLEMEGGGAAPLPLLPNKLGSGRPCVLRCGGVDVPLAGRGGEEGI